MSEGSAYAAIARSVIDSTAAADLLERQSPAVVLERIARGGGATNWFLLRTPDDLEALSNRLRPGSCVSFYFDDRFTLGAMDADTRAAILDIAALDSSAILGAVSASTIEISVDFPSGKNELDEFLSDHEATSFVYGRFPGRDDDSTRAVTVTLPDADGVTRAHPH
jgi:hypothetical protein